jgi:LL-H family phage holin
MNQVTEILTPLALAVLTALASVAAVAIQKGKDAAISWLKSHTNEKNQAVIMQLAQEGYVFAEKWAEGAGAEKLATAADYLSKQLQARGIEITAAQLHAAVQNAWQQANPTK